MKLQKALQLIIVGSLGLTLASALQSCGTEDKKESQLSWADDVNPVVKASCADSGCHGTTDPGGIVYEGMEDNFKAQKADILSRMNLDPSDDNYMPRGTTISAEDKKKITDYLAQ